MRQEQRPPHRAQKPTKRMIKATTTNLEQWHFHFATTDVESNCTGSTALESINICNICDIQKLIACLGIQGREPTTDEESILYYKSLSKSGRAEASSPTCSVEEFIELPRDQNVPNDSIEYGLLRNYPRCGAIPRQVSLLPLLKRRRSHYRRNEKGKMVQRRGFLESNWKPRDRSSNVYSFPTHLHRKEPRWHPMLIEMHGAYFLQIIQSDSGCKILSNYFF